MLLTTVDDILITADNGGHWKELTAPLPHKAVVDVLPVDDTVYVLTSNGAVHRTTDVGLTWNQSKRYKSGQTNRLFQDTFGVGAFEAQTPNKVDSTTNAHFSVRDSTLSVQLDNGLRISITSNAIRDVTCMAATDSVVYVGRARLPVLAVRLTDHTISELGMGHLNQEHIAVLRIHNNYLYAGVMLGLGGLHRRPLTGNYWEYVNIDRNTETVEVQCIVSGTKGLYAGFRDHGVAWLPDGGHVAYPIHEGLAGALIQTADAYRGGYIITARLRGLIHVKRCGLDVERFSSSLPYSGEYVTGVSDSAVIVGLYHGLVIRSKDDGKHWDTLSVRFGESAINRIRSYGNTVFICTNDGTWSSPDNGDTWSRAFSQLPEQTVQDVHKSPNGWIVRTNQGAFVCDSTGSYTKFAPEGNLPRAPHIIDVQVNGTMIYATGFPGIFTSSDGGKTWKIFTVADNSIVQTITVINDLVFFAGVRGDVFYVNIRDLD
ncbi:MAG: hypothetical protein FGM32_04985 [Candidatus Kapabacteria bacterium]|nr:hypothetical protein [Candidatus Kapabacteria bacterium]